MVNLVLVMINLLLKQVGVTLVLHIASPSMSATYYTATTDNISNPTKFTGDNHIWNCNSNGITSKNSFRNFTLERIVN